MNRLNVLSERIGNSGKQNLQALNLSQSSIAQEDSVSIVAIMKFKPGSLEEAKPSLNKLIETTRKEEGNIRYDWFQDSKESDTVIVLEQFSGFPALITHSKSAHMKEAMGKFKQWLKSPAQIKILNPINVKSK